MMSEAIAWSCACEEEPQRARERKENRAPGTGAARERRNGDRHPFRSTSPPANETKASSPRPTHQPNTRNVDVFI